MSKYFIEKETHRIDFEDGQWVDVKQELSQSDMDAINRKAQSDEDLGTLSLKTMITDWSFKDDSDNKVPITPENISNLRTKYRMVVLKEINRLVAESQKFLKN